MTDPTSTSGSSTPQFRVDDNAQPFRLGPRPSGSGSDSDLVDQTRNQIRNLVEEIAELAKSGCSTAAFFEGFLSKTTSALASSGGVIWIRPGEDQPLEIACHINFNQSLLAISETAQAQHTQLLQHILTAAEPTIVPPDTAGSGSSAGNPLSHLLLFAPLQIDQQLVGLVEIFQRPGGGPATQRGYLRFLVQMAEIASDFLKSRRLQEYAEQQLLWKELQEFTRLVHRSLDPEQVAYTIANEARRIIGSDRLAVSLSSGTRQQVVAVSGLDSIERRAAEVRRLGELATTVARGREPLWYQHPDQPLPPQIEKALQAYLDQSHGRAIAVLPLAKRTEQVTSNNRPSPSDPPFATLIIEQLSSTEFPDQLRRRVQLLEDHANGALANALKVERIPLRKLLQSVQLLFRPFERAQLGRTATVLGGLFLITAVLTLLPWSFTLGAKGKLLPRDRQEIYAAVSGTLTEVIERDSSSGEVAAGSVLAQMSNHELQLQLERLTGELAKAEAQISNLNHQQLEKSRGQNREQERRDRFYVETELAKAAALRDSLRQELQIAQQQVEALTIRSPIAGELVDWQLRRQLLGRPVSRGDRLMTVVAPDSKFEVELFVPEKRMGHLLAAANQSPEPLTVSFTLASHPDQQILGQIIQIEPVLALHETEGNSARVLVEFENTQTNRDLLRTGTRVTARINCGSRSLGYVLFHELLETIVSTWRFWI